MNDFGDNLKKTRVEKGFSQGKLAELMELDPSHVSRYERGLTQPSISVAMKFAKTLGISLNRLAYGPDNEAVKDSIIDSELLHMFQQLQALEENDITAVKTMMQAFIFKEEIQRKLAS
jgi:transcriptional regulator with XRE-family HTH domain